MKLSIENYLQAVPKAELHVHLEGSIQPGTLLELARRNGVELPSQSVEGLREWFTFRDFSHFVEIYGKIVSCLRTAEDYELIAYEFGAEMARQNVRYAEVTFSPSAHALRGKGAEIYLAGLRRGRDRAKQDFGVELHWVFDIVRSFLNHPDEVDYADYTTGVAIEGMSEGVVALGLGGMEVGYPPEPFAPYFERALKAGLSSTPHAGETVGPSSVWGAVRELGATRIGHGVRAIEDPQLIEYLAEQRIVLEVNPTSNLCLSVYPDLARHPLRRLHEAGVIVTINSDDPPLFNTTLNDEVLLLSTAFGFDIATIDQILLNAVRSSFLPPERKQQMEAEFKAEMVALKEQFLPPQ